MGKMQYGIHQMYPPPLRVANKDVITPPVPVLYFSFYVSKTHYVPTGPGGNYYSRLVDKKVGLRKYFFENFISEGRNNNISNIFLNRCTFAKML
jgi:hypothetical protein